MRLECRDIGYRYPNTEAAVFRGLSFRITQPGFHALFGPSGVGKTSLAKILTGQFAQFSGRIIKEDLYPLLYTYNLERLPNWSSTGRHLEKITPPGRTELKDTLLERFGLGDLTTARFSTLSLGQKNRVNLIRYLLQDFQVLVMDESLANVDEPMREKIILKIKELFPDRCFIYISHNVAEVSKFCRQIVVLRSVHKQPQTLMVSGRDHMAHSRLEKSALEKTMLEVMNSA